MSSQTSILYYRFVTSILLYYLPWTVMFFIHLHIAYVHTTACTIYARATPPRHKCIPCVPPPAPFPAQNWRTVPMRTFPAYHAYHSSVPCVPFIRTTRTIQAHPPAPSRRTMRTIHTYHPYHLCAPPRTIQAYHAYHLYVPPVPYRRTPPHHPGVPYVPFLRTTCAYPYTLRTVPSHRALLLKFDNLCIASVAILCLYLGSC